LAASLVISVISVISNRRCDVCFWHLADNPATPAFVRYWSNSEQSLILARDGLSAYDPTATLAVHCGNGFDAGFSPYQITRLSRYNAVSRALERT
jgi:hypothetical protein